MERGVGGSNGDKARRGSGLSVNATIQVSAIAVVFLSAICESAFATPVCGNKERCLDGYHARLSAGSSGYLELHLPTGKKRGQQAERPLWWHVCNDQPTAFSVQAAVVACKQIGLNRGALLRDRADVDKNVVGSEALWLKDLRCRGDEAELGECHLGNMKKRRCFSFVDVVCSPAYEKEKNSRQSLEMKLLTQTKTAAKLSQDLTDTAQSRELLKMDNLNLKQVVAYLQQQLQNVSSTLSHYESSTGFDAKTSKENHCAAVDDSAFNQCRQDLAKLAEVLAAEREQASAKIGQIEMSRSKVAKELAAEREQSSVKLAQVLAAEREQASAKLAQVQGAEREMSQEKLDRLLALEREQAQAKLVKELAAEREQGPSKLAQVLEAERERAEAKFIHMLAAERKQAEAKLTQVLAAEREQAQKTTKLRPGETLSSLFVFAVVPLCLIAFICKLTCGMFSAALCSSHSAKEGLLGGSLQDEEALSSRLSTNPGCRNKGDVGTVTSTTCGSVDESCGEFTFCTRDKTTDDGIIRVITVQCPGVDHSGVNIELTFNGCVISLKRPGSSGLKGWWKKRFDFEISDGLFEFKEDQAQLENGVLQVVFSFHSRMFRFPKLGKRDSTDIDYCRWMNESDLSDESSSLSEIQQREGPQRFDISSQKVESVTSQSDIAAGIISDSASVYSSWSACAIDTK
eukprot:TRINITY_DN7024_c0_g1_i2.p1 TRINITY_DN7024_c0_g1~~TRINITY_DN7024_c0_g1_i2.p1  ORF type:complete len:687 (+),score=112.24 TRINITY_DN7024_c0_g1_i2:124-2184(+)